MTILILALFTIIRTATALDVPDWLNPFLPDPGNGSIQGNIKCYSLPYGAMGFVSHVMTYWTILCLIFSVKPWNPFRRLKHYKLDLSLGLASLVATVVLTALAVVRCRFSWQFVCIAVWKLLLSIALGCCTVHRALMVRRDRQASRDRRDISPGFSIAPAAWLVFYCFGIVIGLAGLISVVVDTWPTRSKAMEIISAVFGGTVLLVAISSVAILLCCGYPHVAVVSAAFGPIAMVGILMAFYSDWALAAIAVQEGGNWAGFPSSDFARLYWLYFVAKKLPFLSS